MRAFTLLLLLVMPCALAEPQQPSHPNIVFILADDLGYGDVGAMNPESRIPTPNIDRIGREGVIFTDAHTASAVCTPTRYGFLTGRYSWRTRLKQGVLFGYDPPLLEDERLTVAEMLRDNGYATGCFGKWHLGLDLPKIDPKRSPRENIDFSARIGGGPLDHGFDTFFGIAASLDMEPYYYIENDRALEAPTKQIEGRTGKEMYRAGACAPNFRHEEVLPKCAERAVSWLETLKESGTEKPFFLYFPMSAPHTPILPAREWQEKHELGSYADFVMQVDATVGQLLDAIEASGATANTLVIFTSDNGFARSADFKSLEAQGHYPSKQFRGYKTDLFEGGHRVPFLARWPARIEQGGRRVSQTICLNDFMATAADITGTKIPPNAAEDSVSFLPALTREEAPAVREAIVHHSSNGYFAIRRGDWKLLFTGGSGGNSEPKSHRDDLNLPRAQLYNLANDAQEQHNLAQAHPEIVSELTALMERYIREGRSTPGPSQENHGEIILWGPGQKNEHL